ncbi:MAG: cysteine desulfurase-like protein [Planctomycetes bacterium]|nr:cysteine desulfurase-like protein [Planctomycetota bacterium]
MLNIPKIVENFPKLRQSSEIHADAPGGTQVPETVINAISHYLIHQNANLGAPFRTSKESDQTLLYAGNTVQALLNARKNSEIIFGNNMTSLTFHISRSIGNTLQPGDRILLSKLDHEANISPWQLMAKDKKCEVDFVEIDSETCTFNKTDLEQKLSKKPKLFAFTACSNATGTLNDIKNLTKMAHHAGAIVYVDAVHYAPHKLIDVIEWDCDFLACSAYKFFGPHVGILYGKESILNNLQPYKVRPAADSNPGKWMTGTQNHEGIAGTAAAIDYLASLSGASSSTIKRTALEAAFNRIEAYEKTLATSFLQGIKKLNGIEIVGLKDLTTINQRVPTFSLTSNKVSAVDMAKQLALKGIFAYSGNFYAKTLMETLGYEAKGGVLRIGFVHYNDLAQVEVILNELKMLLK